MKNEIIKVLDESSDFSFEMKVLKLVNDLNYKTEHSGTYLDPYSRVNREFDIRARKNISKDKFIKLAIECKNISKEVPIIVHSVKAKPVELMHTLMLQYEGYREQTRSDHLYMAIRTQYKHPMVAYEVSQRLDSSNNIFNSLYSNFQFIGKSIDKLKTKNKGQKGEQIILDDSEIYPKYSQAINSTVDLITEISIHNEFLSQFLVMPIFVVPDDTLWEVRYNDDGTLCGDPAQVERIPFYINKVFDEELGPTFPWFKVDYLEIVTLSGLKKLLFEIVGDMNHRPTFISEDDVMKALRKKEYL